ncbi:hypothetical protein H6F83_11790 [Coleofasciculus sp. FACHB-125]|nr:hypothetical protein [Coleofasciculus sp. FACHB-125]
MANASVEPSPTLLNSIEVRRIEGQIQQPQASLIKQWCNASAMMERRVINNYHLSLMVNQMCGLIARMPSA